MLAYFQSSNLLVNNLLVLKSLVPVTVTVTIQVRRSADEARLAGFQARYKITTLTYLLNS